MDHPETVYKLPSELREISGIAWVGANRLACIQDEAGKIFYYNLKRGDVRGRQTFEANHDYEGIAVAGDTLFVLKSDGTIFKINTATEDSLITERIETHLKKADNTEGICYDSAYSRLLVVCKGIYGKKINRHTVRIYAYSLSDGTLSADPVYAIPLGGIFDYISQNKIQADARETFKEENSDKPVSFFEASDIAVSPVDSNIYVLASVGKKILVIDHQGNIRNVAALAPELFTQPEGITFAPDGTMYISDEGKNHKGNIMEFPVQKQ
ncbi:MAG: SdiA-regulated domain-containing protein [Bacteroidia bacterium]|nr:SdiA-regulated domain-containing protein [Bacteroidia bacterium]